MCEENTWAAQIEDIDFMFEYMSEQEIKEFWEELKRVDRLADLLNKGYSFGGGTFSKSVFVYKD